MIYLTLLVAFFLGGIPFSWILIWFLKGVDLRTVGSGNPGATNAWRLAGPRWGTLALFLDIAKGSAGALAPLAILGETSPSWACAACGLAAILGNVFCPFLKFKGGKAVATTAGVFVALTPIGFVLTFGFFALLVWSTNKISIGSMGGAVFLAFFLTFEWFLGFGDRPDLSVVLLMWLAGALVFLRHATNIRRLREGSESNFTDVIEEGNEGSSDE